jgi:hypothetical protein
MLAVPRILFSYLAALLAVSGAASIADAAWLAVKNDTNRIIVVQSAVTVNGQIKRGRPTRLLPGETVREFLQPQQMALEVYDAHSPNKPVLTSKLLIRNENQIFSVASGPKGVVVAPVSSK